MSTDRPNPFSAMARPRSSPQIRAVSAIGPTTDHRISPRWWRWSIGVVAGVLVLMLVVNTAPGPTADTLPTPIPAPTASTDAGSAVTQASPVPIPTPSAPAPTETLATLRDPLTGVSLRAPQGWRLLTGSGAAVAVGDDCGQTGLAVVPVMVSSDGDPAGNLDEFLGRFATGVSERGSEFSHGTITAVGRTASAAVSGAWCGSAKLGSAQLLGEGRRALVKLVWAPEIEYPDRRAELAAMLQSYEAGLGTSFELFEDDRFGAPVPFGWLATRSDATLLVGDSTTPLTQLVVVFRTQAAEGLPGEAIDAFIQERAISHGWQAVNTTGRPAPPAEFSAQTGWQIAVRDIDYDANGTLLAGRLTALRRAELGGIATVVVLEQSTREDWETVRPLLHTLVPLLTINPDPAVPGAAVGRLPLPVGPPAGGSDLANSWAFRAALARPSEPISGQLGRFIRARGKSAANSSFVDWLVPEQNFDVDSGRYRLTRPDGSVELVEALTE